MKQPTNIEELRDDLNRMYANIENKKIGLNVVKEKTNVAGKIINSLKVQSEYDKNMGYKKKIAYLEVD